MLAGRWTLVAIAIGAILAVAAASAETATAKKHKKARTTQQTTQTRERGTNLFPAGPVYNGPEYLGDDPDPFIRFQLYRDLGGRYGAPD